MKPRSEVSSVQEEESIRQNNVMYVGLIVVGVYMVQPFLTATALDMSASICVVAFAVAIPLLAALVLVSRQEAFRRRLTPSVLVNHVARPIALSGGIVGVVAGFWHIAWIAGVAMLATGIVAVGVHSAGWWRLEQDQILTLPEADEPDQPRQAGEP